MLGLENSQHVPNYVEYSHRDTLVQQVGILLFVLKEMITNLEKINCNDVQNLFQLCLTLCHLAIYTDISVLESLWIEIKDHFDDISHHIRHFQVKYILLIIKKKINKQVEKNGSIFFRSYRITYCQKELEI